MKRKSKISIKILIMLPVLALGLVSIVSNIISISNTRRVNANATTIVNEHMEGIQELSEIQTQLLNIHKLALSHIIAADYDSKIAIVEQIKSDEATLDTMLLSYEKHVSEDDKTIYSEMLANYERFKSSIIFLVVNSADSKTAEAYAYANGDVSTYGNAMQANADTLMTELTTDVASAKAELEQVYNTSLLSGYVTITVSVIAILVAILVVLLRVVKPITTAQKEIKAIIAGIDDHNGDLTKRITIVSDDEIASLGNGINTFMEKLQHIMKMIVINSQKMDVVVNEVNISLASPAR